jgi:hypothetical protein
LRQKPPETYVIGPGDVLGVLVEGVLGDKSTPPPVRIPEQGNVPPALGYPLPVREDGTLPLPQLEPVKVEGLTIGQAEAKVFAAYTGGQKKILQPQTARIVVTLIKPRSYHVLVLREDAGGTTFGTSGGFGVSTNGGGGSFFQETVKTAGFALDLPVYENDVLNALTRSGGLPGPDAENEVIIERGANPNAGKVPDSARCGDAQAEQFAGRGTQTLRIPLRAYPDEPVTIRPQDVLLQTGDVVLVRRRKGEYFYTGGLLPSRAFPLPRDRDLDVLQALALVGGPIVNGGLNANNLSGQLVQSGLGFPSPSQITILRKTSHFGQVPILVSINRALRDPRERINLQPGDVMILQQTVDEGIAQYLTTNLRFNILGFLIRQRDLTFTGTGTFP